MRMVDFYKKKEYLLQILSDGLSSVPSNQVILNERIAELEQKSTAILDDLSETYKAMQYGNRVVSDQTHKRRVPLLNMDVEGNDFSSIIEVIVIFVITMWLVLENIRFQVDWLGTNLQVEPVKFKALIRSNFFFNVSNDTNITIFIQKFALLFSLITVLICAYLDIPSGFLNYTAFSTSDSYWINFMQLRRLH